MKYSMSVTMMPVCVVSGCVTLDKLLAENKEKLMELSSPSTTILPSWGEDPDTEDIYKVILRGQCHENSITFCHMWCCFWPKQWTANWFLPFYTLPSKSQDFKNDVLTSHKRHIVCHGAPASANRYRYVLRHFQNTQPPSCHRFGHQCRSLPQGLDLECVMILAG